MTQPWEYGFGLFISKIDTSTNKFKLLLNKFSTVEIYILIDSLVLQAETKSN
ncbi:hypothetical protein BH24ACI1_BH24ACI1_03950 [soil metagenome]